MLEYILKVDPTAPQEKASKLAEIWNKVVTLIITEMHALSKPHIKELHINLREEMVLKHAELILIISEKVVKDRMGDSTIDGIDSNIERRECFSSEGMERIHNTAKNAAEGFWLPIYNKRWQPKTKAALKRDKYPRKRTINPSSVEENHFIPKSFIRRYWSENQVVYRNIKTSKELKEKKVTPLGNWGFEKNLYSDELEAIFGLLEGDVVKPIQMLLNVEPLNRIQRQTLVTFIVFQKLRNPHLIKPIIVSIKDFLLASGEIEKSENKTYIRSLYESMYDERELYQDFIKPIIYSQWVVVRSDVPEFVLPDICNLLGSYGNEKYVLMPLTPTDCLIILPIKIDKPRIVPLYIKGSITMIEDISCLLRSKAEIDFLSHRDALFLNIMENTDEILQRIIVTLTKVLIDKQ